MPININDIINNSKKFNKPVASRGGSSSYSFGIVNSEGNGKRISLSKALAEKLDVHDLENNSHVYVAISEEDRVVIISKSEVLSHGYNCKLSKSGEKRISYNADIVHGITDAFSLPFNTRTSMSFSNIEFDKAPDGTDVAYVHLDEDDIKRATA